MLQSKGFIISNDRRLSKAPIPKASNNPCVTVVFASSCFFSPRYPAISTFTPTPIQIDAAFISVVIGNDRETAVSAFSLNRAINALSIRL